jgi:hypothetical protein
MADDGELIVLAPGVKKFGKMEVSTNSFESAVMLVLRRS